MLKEQIYLCVLFFSCCFFPSQDVYTLILSCRLSVGSMRTQRIGTQEIVLPHVPVRQEKSPGCNSGAEVGLRKGSGFWVPPSPLGRTRLPGIWGVCLGAGFLLCTTLHQGQPGIAGAAGLERNNNSCLCCWVTLEINEWL